MVAHTTELYFECHITVEPVYGERLEALKALAQPYRFRVADLLMRKRLEDVPERSRFDTFLTARGHWYTDLERRMRLMIAECHRADYLVWRTKIENTLLDERNPQA